MSKKYCYLFSEGNANMRELLGGKGANLAEMTNIGLPVPQGFTVTTEACTQYYEDGREKMCIRDSTWTETGSRPQKPDIYLRYKHPRKGSFRRKRREKIELQGCAAACKSLQSETAVSYTHLRSRPMKACAVISTIP